MTFPEKNFVLLASWNLHPLKNIKTHCLKLFWRVEPGKKIFFNFFRQKCNIIVVHTCAFYRLSKLAKFSEIWPQEGRKQRKTPKSENGDFSNAYKDFLMRSFLIIIMNVDKHFCRELENRPIKKSESKHNKQSKKLIFRGVPSGFFAVPGSLPPWLRISLKKK